MEKTLMKPEEKPTDAGGVGVTLRRTRDDSVDTAPGLGAKLAITLFAVAVLVIFRLLNLKLESAELVLVGLAFVPWLAAFVENIKIGSGGVELAFLKRKLANLENKVDTEVAPLAEEADKKASAAKDAAFGGLGKQPEADTTFEKFDDLREVDVTFVSASSDDPQKGRWGGENFKDGRKLSARVEKIPGESYYRRIVMKVESTNSEDNPLTGAVTFHLHPTFSPTDVKVAVVNGVAELSRVGYGAFTIGAEADNGKTKLEFDLTALDDGDDFFRR